MRMYMIQMFRPWPLSVLTFCILILQTQAFLSLMPPLGSIGITARPFGDHPQATPKEVFLPRCDVFYLQSDYLLGEAPEVRPSLHPTTINALSECLKARALNDGTHKLRLSDSTTPLDVALAASGIAANAVESRQKLSHADNMILYPEEEQTIAGRVVGVMMRIDSLEEELHQRVSRFNWLRDSDALFTFGLLRTGNLGVEQRIIEDPLFAMNRAECLLAMFILAVEIPTLKRIKKKVPDESKIDFLDAERYKVLLENYEGVVMR